MFGFSEREGNWTIQRAVTSWIYEDDYIVMSDSASAGAAPGDYMERGSYTWIVISPSDGAVNIGLEFQSSDSKPSKAVMTVNARVDLVFVMYVDGVFRTATLTGRQVELAKNNDHSFAPGIVASWSFDNKGIVLPTLKKAAEAHSTMFVFVLGHPTMYTKVRSHEQLLPSSSRLPLTTLASLLTSSNSDYIELAPTVPCDETRTLRAHIKTLCRASTYFDSLLQSDFSEAQALRHSFQHDAGSITLAVSPMVDRPSLDNEVSSLEHARAVRDNPIRTDSRPFLKVPEISYSELQTLLFYVHTGEAVFARESRSINENSKNSTIAGDNDSRLADLSEPWWTGTLEPATALDMYRVADKYCIRGLCQEALGHIRSELQSTRHDRSRLLEDMKAHKEITWFPEVNSIYREEFDLLYKSDDFRLLFWTELMSMMEINRN